MGNRRHIDSLLDLYLFYLLHYITYLFQEQSTSNVCILTSATYRKVVGSSEYGYHRANKNLFLQLAAFYFSSKILFCRLFNNKEESFRHTFTQLTWRQ